jgi:hypothetical protein
MRNRARIFYFYFTVMLLFAACFWVSEIGRAKQRRAINLVFHARAVAVTNSIVLNPSNAAVAGTLGKSGERQFSTALEYFRVHTGATNAGAAIMAAENKIGGESGGYLSQREFSAALEKIGTDGCPTDFKDAWNGYVAAWKSHCSLSADDRLFALTKMNHSEGLKFTAVSLQDDHKDVESAWIRCEYFASTYQVEDTSDFDF